jgi:hypothetical protein
MTTENPGFQPASFTDPFASRPKVRRVDVHVLYADGSAAHHAVNGHCNVKTGVDPTVFEEIQSYGSTHPLRSSMVTGSSQLIIDGIQAEDYAGTLYPNPEVTAQLKATYAANVLADAKPSPYPPVHPFRFEQGDILRMPRSERIPNGVPNRKNRRSSEGTTWQVDSIDYDINALKWRANLVSRDGKFRWAIHAGGPDAAGATKVDKWPLRRGDFVTYQSGDSQYIYKVVGQAKRGDHYWVGKAGVDLREGLGTIAYNAEKGPAVFVDDAQGLRSWFYEKDLTRVDRDQVKIVKKAETWSV